MVTKKKTPPKKKAISIKSPKSKRVSSPKKTTPKKVTDKETAIQKITLASLESLQNALTKEALKLVDEAADILRSGMQTSQKKVSRTREATHQRAHSLLGKATRHLDDALKSGSSFLHKAIDKI